MTDLLRDLYFDHLGAWAISLSLLTLALDLLRRALRSADDYEETP